VPLIAVGGLVVFVEHRGDARALFDCLNMVTEGQHGTL
jgi:hypothetical protein